MITVHAGEAFSVEMRATPATGYLWSLAGVPAGVEFIGDSFTADPRAARVVPAAGRQVFHFRAGSQGTVELQFVLKRSWEAGAADRHAEQVLVLP